MHLIKFIATFMGLLHLARSSQECQPNEPKSLEPWRVTRLSTFSPSLRPNGGSNSSNIAVVITNSNSTSAGVVPNGGAAFDASTANCTARWLTASESPYGNSYDCTQATWKMEVLEANGTWKSPTEKFDLRFTLTSNETGDGDVYSTILVGREHFEVGKNLEGSCGGSGVCSWSLKAASIPVLIQPTLVSCEKIS
ncbi:hypothetical protein F4779DRAFT_575921 [Xylariaceae sp. FL0662B]|nr:hypothetical protein F4779DRAFT_575921 [Xylariaceae sp. FL0662B]